MGLFNHLEIAAITPRYYLGGSAPTFTWSFEKQSNHTLLKTQFAALPVCVQESFGTLPGVF